MIYNKYKRMKKQYSEDGGLTWKDYIPYEYVIGELVEADSQECNMSGDVKAIYRWVDEEYCDGYDLTQKRTRQVSTDNGVSWKDTGEYEFNILEKNSSECAEVEWFEEGTICVGDGEPEYKYDVRFVCEGNKRIKITEKLSSMDGEKWTTTGEVTRETMSEGKNICELMNNEYYSQYLTIRLLDTIDVNICSVFNSYGAGFMVKSDALDDGEWHYEGNVERHLEAGTTIQFKRVSEKTFTRNDNSWGFFRRFGRFDVYGNINSLYAGDNFMDDLRSYRFMFQHLFAQSKVVDASNLIIPYNSVQDLAFYQMFIYCDYLIKAPSVLPAEFVNYRGYEEMFSGCTSLEEGPKEIWAKELGEQACLKMFIACYSMKEFPMFAPNVLGNSCCNNMFYECRSIKDIGKLTLPSMELKRGCYSYMFSQCELLENAPELPATELEESCYGSMFWGCTSLEKAPEILPATVLAESCYSYMFSGCTSLEKAPELPAKTLVNNCYISMFSNCSKLNYVKCLAEKNTTSSRYTDNWLKNVSPTGTFVKKRGVEWRTADYGIPSGWTIEEID